MVRGKPLSFVGDNIKDMVISPTALVKFTKDALFSVR